MPKKTQKRKSPKPAPATARAAGLHASTLNDPLRPQQPLVSGKWLLSALGIVVASAAVCAYAALCLLFYQGSWQLIFHPSRTITTTPASLGLAYDDIRFDYTETGKSQLAGWWIPAGTDASYPANTILLLHDGHGSLSDSTSQIQALHALGIHVFAFDYRGFGQSADAHPSEQSMAQDADAAWTYLTGTRHLAARSISIYGVGLGAPLAASAASRHPGAATLVLENVSPTALTLFAADARTKLLPVRLLTSDRFDATATMATLKTPKLFLDRSSTDRNNTDRSSRTQTQSLFQSAGHPKQLFQIAPEDHARYLDTLRRFLDESLQHP